MVVNPDVTTLVTNIGLLVTDIVGYFGDILTMFTTEPILIMFFGIFFVGGVIGLTIRLLHRN